MSWRETRVGSRLGDVVTALEGPVVPQEFVHRVENDSGDQDWAAACAVRNVWYDAVEASQRVLDATTIQELLEQQKLIRTNRERSAQDTAPMLEPTTTH
jgi:DNA-binding IscR family transcriptional regulator